MTDLAKLSVAVAAESEDLSVVGEHECVMKPCIHYM
jgi:hypothetical protein